MIASSATIDRMAKKKKGDGTGRPSGRSPAYTVFARIPPEMGEAMEAYIASLRPKPTATSVLQHFIEEGLRQVGFWPFTPQGDD